MTNIFELPAVILDLISVFLTDKELCKLLLTQNGNLWLITEETQSSIFFTRQFWKDRLLRRFNPASVKDFTTFFESEAPSISHTWYPWRAVCFTTSSLACSHVEEGSFLGRSWTLLYSPRTKHHPPLFTLPFLQCLNTGNLCTKAKSGTSRLIACSIQRSVKLWPFIQAFPPLYKTAIDSFIPYYSSDVDGFSLSRLQQKLSRICSISGKDVAVSTYPSVLVLKCTNDTVAPNGFLRSSSGHCPKLQATTICVFINGRWPFKKYPSKICNDIDCPSPSQIYIMSSSDPERVYSNLSPLSMVTSSSNDFKIDFTTGICFGGEFGCSPISIDRDLAHGSSYPSLEYGMPHSLMSSAKQLGNGFLITSFEVWAPYWAWNPEHHHPRMVSKRREIRHEQRVKQLKMRRAQQVQQKENRTALNILSNSNDFGQWDNTPQKVRLLLEQFGNVALQQPTYRPENNDEDLVSRKRYLETGRDETVGENDNENVKDDQGVDDYWDIVSDDESHAELSFSDIIQENRDASRREVHVLFPELSHNPSRESHSQI